MEKKIAVNEFITTYTSADDKKAVINNIIVNKYIPFRIKLNCSQNIIVNHNLTDNNIQSDTGRMYLSFTASVLRLYTNLDISATETDVDYDMLQEHGLIDIIFQSIGKDLEEYRKIFAMCEEDFRSNYLSTHSFVQRQLGKIINVLEKYVRSLQNWLDKVDNNKIDSLLNEVQKHTKEL